MLAVLGEAAHGEPTLPQAAPQTHSTVRLPQEYSGCSMPSPVSCNDLLRRNMQIWTSLWAQGTMSLSFMAPFREQGHRFGCQSGAGRTQIAHNVQLQSITIVLRSMEEAGRPRPVTAGCKHSSRACSRSYPMMNLSVEIYMWLWQLTVPKVCRQMWIYCILVPHQICHSKMLVAGYLHA